MKLHRFSVRLAFRRHGVRLMLVLLAAGVALVSANLGAAQTNALGEPVIIPGINIAGWGQVDEVLGRFSRPAGPTPKVPAVLILHGAFGVDGRGVFYAKALNEAGIAALEITMFPPNSPPRDGPKATMPHAAAALKWLAAQPTVDSRRLGIMGFSWGGLMTVLMSSELVQERLGQNVPRPVAFAPFYPTCSLLARIFMNPRSAFYNAHTRMSGAAMLIQVGTRDDFEEGERTCDALVSMWPAAARDHTIVRYIEGATHDFDSQGLGKNFYARLSHAGHGGMVSVVPSPKDAAEARQTVVNFFVKHLNP